MTQFLTFDCYGTLLNEAPLYDRVMAIARTLGVDGQAARDAFEQYQDSRDNMHPYLDYTVLLRNNLIHLDYRFDQQHQFERYFADMLQIHRSLKPFPEVKQTLQTLADRGYKLILMSNSSWDIIPANAEALGLPVDIWTAEDFHAYKPDLAFFRGVAAQYGFDEHNHWHIAHGFGSDMVPAAAMSWPSVWVQRGAAQPDSPVRPTRQVQTLDEVLDFIK